MEMYFIGFLCLLLLGYVLSEIQHENACIVAYEEMKIRHVFHCQDCHVIYSSKLNHESCKCPACKKENYYLRF